MMKKAVSLFLSSILLLSLSGCSTPVQQPQPEVPDTTPEVTLPVDIPFQLPVYPDFPLHPAYCENRSNLVVGSLLYEPLFALDPQFQAQPVLCKNYEVSEDGLTWTLTLQPNVTFSDGTPLTGEVVAEALRLVKSGSAHYAPRLSDVRSITGKELTVTITLLRPNSALDTLLDIPIALGEDAFPAGTGCYTLSRQEEEWHLQAREDWWQALSLPVEMIPLTFISKSDDLVFSFDSGDVSMVDVDLMGTNPLGYSGNYESWDYSTTAMVYLGYNTQKGPCKQVDTRLAIARSIDRNSIVQVDLARHGIPSALPIHPQHPHYREALAQLLGYAPQPAEIPGQRLTLLVNTENTARLNAAVRIAEQLTAEGWNVTLSKLSFEDYTAALRKGEFDLYLAEVVLTADFDLSALLLPRGALNFGSWDDPATQQLLDALRTAPANERSSAAIGLYTHLSQHVPIAPICFKNASVLTRWGQLSGLDPVRGNLFYHFENWTIN